MHDEPGSSEVGASATPILEREQAIAAVDGVIADALSAAGRVLLIEGEAGIGKTALMRVAATRALDEGVEALTARGGTLEQKFGFGVVRQLLERRLSRSHSDRERLLSGAAALAEQALAPEASSTSPDPAQGVLHGLYWLVANLAEERPVALLVDDIQWSDVPSLRFLHYLARRLDGMRVALVIAHRTGEPSGDEDLLRELTLEAPAPVIRPNALSEAAVAELVTLTLGHGATTELSAATHKASTGNPFLVMELLAELRAERRPAAELRPERLKRLAPERVKSSVSLRVGRLGGPTLALARAVAVLGNDADVETVGSLCGLEPGELHAGTAALVEAGILESGGLRFVHPLVQNAIYEDMSGAERHRLHSAAASILETRTASPEEVAAHLLSSDANGDERVVRTLRAAAGIALARGAPESAVRYLRRAVEEPPGADLPEVTRDLGVAEVTSGDAAGLDRLRAAIDLAAPGEDRAAIALTLGRLLIPHGRIQEALEAYDRGISAAGESDLAVLIESEARTAATLIGQRRASLRSRDEIDALNPRLALLVKAGEAWDMAFDARNAADATALAREALEGGIFADHGAISPTPWDAVATLIAAEELDLAERSIDEAVTTAGGSWMLFTILAWSFRAWVQNERGEVNTAANDAQVALDATVAAGVGPGINLLATAFLARALTERGETDEAASLLQGAFAMAAPTGELPLTYIADHLLLARGCTRRASGDVTGAIDDLRLLERRAQRFLREGETERLAVIAAAPYREPLALALSRSGERDEAIRIAHEALDVATAWGRPRALGAAHHALGVVSGGDEEIAALVTAVGYLERAPDRLTHARALVDLGAALRRSGSRADAKDYLAKGMDLAHRCGALALLERAHSELSIAGARPRRFVLTGVDALTPSELRVAEMALEGMTNKDIAQALFVTLRTIEMHLTSAYRKLQIGSRRELEKALRRDVGFAEDEPG